MLRIRRLGLCLWLGLAAVALPPAAAQDQASIERGRKYAESVCERCHAIDAGEIHSPVAGLAGFEEIANAPGMTALALKVWFKSPHPTMPNFILSPNEIDDLVAYIQSLKSKR